MDNKKIKIGAILATILFLIILPIISAEETVCCQKLTNGNWCQNAPIEECDLSVGVPSPTSCDATSYCAAGTCIDTDKGSCMPNTPKLRCETEGGIWDSSPKSEIDMCQNGCCVVGEGVAFVSQAECKQLATDYGINTTFRGDIDTEATCFELATPTAKGACVFDSLDCSMTTKENCLSQGGNFNEGFLCTATHLETNCAKTENTQCEEDGKVYFTDSCGNLANIYDASKFTKNENAWTIEMENYWTSIIESTCAASADCGNCNYIEGSTCKRYESNSLETPTRPTYGDYVCADLACYYDNDGDGKEERYEHGETWCANSEGIFPDIEIDPLLGTFVNNDILEELSKETEYNLPGSRYYKLNCMDGEVIVEPCKDYRNEYCVESTFDNGFKIAQCQSNNWRDCTLQGSKTSCEDSSRDCKWVYGYRFDFQKTTTTDSRSEETQGSCVPLYAPGFDFWNSEGDASNLCGVADIQDSALYETSFLRSRDKFSDQPTCDTTSEKDAVSRCVDNCYTIPDYGKKSPEGEYFDVSTLIGVHQGESLPSHFEDYCISDRKAYYCEDRSGEVVGKDADCTEKKGRELPIFFTHEEWLESIRERARSLGDCGYKESAFGEYSLPESEIISAIFQKLKQDMQTVKGDGPGSENIYIGNEMVADGYREDNLLPGEELINGGGQ